MRGPLADFLREVRDGFDAFDDRYDWEHWLEQAQKNIVAITIVFCFVVITGSCVMVPVTAVMRAGTHEEAASPSESESLAHWRNPWSLEKPEGRATR